ncbi:PadR family transcriptional regulator, partial [Subtercola sp. Z020]|uniref:PadR family transcriptional regulator n=1 Tax=Subtercola sp. Z020 TaxID=2080582 RepID=UPI00130D7DE9
MSVRSNILAVLTLGPAYGLQLHAEIEARTDRAGRINVGQIYSTLTRLVEAGLVGSAPRGEDSLPLYELTDAGRREAAAWLGEIGTAAPSWAEMVEQVLLVASLPGVSLDALLDDYRAFWCGVVGAVSEGRDEQHLLHHLGPR